MNLSRREMLAASALLLARPGMSPAAKPAGTEPEVAAFLEALGATVT